MYFSGTEFTIQNIVPINSVPNGNSQPKKK